MRSGFSLLEAVTASAIVLLTVTAISLCIGNVTHARGRLDHTMTDDRALRCAAERLRSLPYFCTTRSAEPAGAYASPDLVGAVFPHAVSALNDASARYVVDGEAEAPAGAFVTLLDEQGVQVQCVARFLRDSDGPALDAAAVTGWEWDVGERPPGTAISLKLTVASGGATRRFSLTRWALSSPEVGRMTMVCG